MIGLGLSHEAQRAFHRTLLTSHSIRISAAVLTLEHELVTRFDTAVHDGQVDVTGSDDVTRSASLTFDDGRRALSFGTDSPADGAVFTNRMIKIWRGVLVTDGPEPGWVDVPVFTGPVTAASRSTGRTVISADGKETLTLGAAWTPLTLPKGMRKVDAIEKILRFYGGERRFSFPDLRTRLPRDVSLGRESVPWLVAQKIASSMDRQLFYDGRGVARLRRTPRRPQWRFVDGTGGSILSPPEVSFNLDRVRNTVWVKGGTPRGSKEDGVKAVAIAPPRHPLSPQRLGAHGSERHLLEVIENDQIRSRKEAREVADSRLEDLLRQEVSVTFDSLVVPHLEPMDLIAAETTIGDTNLRQRLVDFTIPLTSEATMSIGTTKKTARQAIRVRRRTRRRSR